jgi:flagellin FlaB
MSGYGYCRERGNAALTTMLILGAFVTVASAIAAVVMNTGLAGSRQVNQTLSTALQRTTTGLSLEGGVLAETDGTRATALLLDLTTSAGSGGVSLDANAPLERTIVSYVDGTTLLQDVPFAVHWLRSDGDSLLEQGELAQIAIDTTGVQPPIVAGHTFTIQIKPANANYLVVERTMPAGSALNRFINLR